MADAMHERMKRAFTALFESPRCSVCRQVLENMVVFAGDCYQCTNHCTCARCNVSLQNGNYITLNNKSYCESCFEHVRPSCKGCKGALDNGQRFFRFGKAYWHDVCFKCHACGEPVDTETFVWTMNKVSCKNCAIKALQRRFLGPSTI